MSGSIQRRFSDLRQAFQTESIDRRKFLQVAGAAAVASGLSHNAAFAAPGQSTIRRVSGAQASNNVLVYGSGQDISNLDPHIGHDYSIAAGQRCVYDSLLRYEGNPAALKPLLATEATPNEDATVWTIKLDPAAKFNDDGAAVDATAVQYNFNRMLRKNLGVAWMFTGIMDENSAQVVDATTLTVTLLKPFAPFDAVLPWLFVANPATVQANDSGGDEGEAWLKENAAGSGPYTIKRWEIGSVYEFERNPNYWYTGFPNLVDSFVWRIIRESSTKRIAMEAGEVQYGDFFTSEDVEALRTDDRFFVNDIPSLTPFAIKLNNQVGPTADINVRKALSLSFDYEAALEVVSGRGTVMEGPLASNLTPWHKEGLPVLRYDIEAAKAALAESQFADGFEMEYVYVTGFAIEEQFGLIFLEGAAELGITVNMVPLVWPDMVSRASLQDTAPASMAVYSGTDYVDPDNFLWQAYHSSQAGFWAAASHYINPELDKWLEDARGLTDEAARKALYDQAQQKLVEDVVEIWVYTEVANDAWVKELGPDTFYPVMGGDIRTLSYK